LIPLCIEIHRSPHCWILPFEFFFFLNCDEKKRKERESNQKKRKKEKKKRMGIVRRDIMGLM
jgi:hypothetical protein